MHTLRLARTLVVVVAAAAAFTALPAAPASAAQSCSSASKARGASVVASSDTAVVFGNGRYYGCLYKKGKVRKLPVSCCFPERFTLGGRYVAYTFRGSAEGDETDRIGLYDLKTGKVKNLDPGNTFEPNVIDTGQIIFGFFVRTNGTIAWLQTSGDQQASVPGPNQVHVVGPDGVNRVIDEGNIPQGSLGLSSDGKTLYWLKDGAPQTAVLP